MPIIQYDSIKDLEDQLLFEQQKIVARHVLDCICNHLNHTRHERDELVETINTWMFRVFNSPVNMDFKPDTKGAHTKYTSTN